MKAIGYQKMGPIETAGFTEFSTDIPDVGVHDLLVEVHGVSLNPVDTKVRKRAEPEGAPKVLGYDAAGIVKKIGSAVSKFSIGDEVFYAGDITRPGTNSELHVVDERIVGKKPSSLGMAEAAGIPLTSITAWELLFDSLGITESDNEAILVIGGAGGVGSILIQLAKKLTKLTVIATASRQDTIDWVKKMGADHVIDHSKPIDTEIEALGIQPKYVAALTGTEGHFDAIINLIKPRGAVAFIDDPEVLNIKSGKQKALRFAWELMFTRPMFNTPDMDEQHKILNRVSKMLDDGTLISTVTNNLGKLSPKTIVEAHKQQESGRVIGKNVLEGLH
ncbi:MAG: zinc-binding alcohol dehydrogenase family protein [Burkholderiales bacterium]|jgi:NADPH2:quinone reductase|tara:strand:- start:3391 stop:4389 length:999 start_codon:yes stop_codon:yes gene_type:complete